MPKNLQKEIKKVQEARRKKQEKEVTSQELKLKERKVRRNHSQRKS